MYVYILINFANISWHCKKIIITVQGDPKSDTIEIILFLQFERYAKLACALTLASWNLNNSC